MVGFLLFSLKTKKGARHSCKDPKGTEGPWSHAVPSGTPVGS